MAADRITQKRHLMDVTFVAGALIAAALTGYALSRSHKPAQADPSPTPAVQASPCVKQPDVPYAGEVVAPPPPQQRQYRPDGDVALPRYQPEGKVAHPR